MENRTAETLNAIEREKMVQLQILTSAIEGQYSYNIVRREIAVKFMAAMLGSGEYDNFHAMANDAIDATDILLQKLEQR